MALLELPANVAVPADIRPLNGSLQFIGNATVLIECAGFTVLTDPNFIRKGDRLHLGLGVTTERLTEPGIQFEELPRVDLIILSHLHADHFDPLVEEELDRSIPIITTPEAAAELRRKGFDAAHGIRTWEEVVVHKG
ncbi:MAG: MBL fold metallo-hydrolase, partial [Dehalococcoidia bacterium]|nr:MBL fold metallo-hydrolase [Dehalococcoidia bacterium]